jgi:Gas vesicle synthesis protein GvpO
VADEEPKRKRREDQGGSSDGKERRPARRRSGAQLAQRARRELSEITGLEAESVTSLERADDGTWKVTVELLELSRVPETDDMLGSYEVELNESGELLGYRRVRRYTRSQAGADQGVQGGAPGGK